ncbi:MAG TPA: DUF1178 family protein [Caldimonas sp.]|jgi:hypothetical protein|nr:DUF1178 family protein [Caldimonas sp.]HEX2540078.1 DUF1178 family protein [Caldimonas sp.]
MKVLNLRCGQQHRYEGWFASEEDFAEQAERAAVACPICGDTEAVRLPSAPRLNVRRHSAPAPSAAPQPSTELTLQSQWLRAVRHVMTSTEDVGERFPEEARRIHYGEVEERGIRGRASREDAEALRDEGIEVMPLPIPDALKGPVQ